MIEAGVEAVGSWEVERRQWGGKHGSGWIWMILNADRLDYNILYSLSLSLSIYIYIYIYKRGEIYCANCANLLHCICKFIAYKRYQQNCANLLRCICIAASHSLRRLHQLCGDPDPVQHTFVGHWLTVFGILHVCNNIWSPKVNKNTPGRKGDKKHFY